MRSKLALVTTSLVLLLGAGIIAAPGALAATSLTWSGIGTDSNWATTANWTPAQAPVGGDALTFPPAAARLSNTNNLTAGTSFTGLSITGTGYTLSGNSVAVPAVSQTAATVVTDTVALPLTGLTTVTQNAANGSALTLSGTIATAGLAVTANQTTTLSGLISGAGGVTMTGGGQVVLSGANTYTGATTINGSDGIINGVQGSSAVTVSAGALEGTGTVGVLTVNGADAQHQAFISPGVPVGTLHSGNFSLGANGVFVPEGTSNSAFDQLSVTGTVTLAGDLIVQPSFHPTIGQTFTIIANDGSDAVSGTFAGLPEGAALTDGTGVFFRISYAGGTNNNDVVLKTVAPPPTSIVTGPGLGGGPHVRTFGGSSLSIIAGDATKPSGANVAAGPFAGGPSDNIVVGSGPGVPPAIRTYASDGTPGNQVQPYPAGFLGGVNAAVLEPGTLVAAAGPGGGPDVRLLAADGTIQNNFFAYDGGFRGGVSVATGDIDGDGAPEIITGAGPGGGPEVRVFSPDGTLLNHFFAFDPGFTGGVNVATADINGDGVSEIVVGAGAGGGPEVRVYSASGTLLDHFFAYDSGFRGGVNVGALPDFVHGHDTIIVGAGPGGGPDVRTFTPAGGLLAAFFAYDSGFHGGVKVAGAVLGQPGA